MEELRFLVDTTMHLTSARASDRARAGGLRCSNPNERVEPDEVPEDRSPDCYGGWGVLAEATPRRWGQEVHVIHSALYNHPTWINFSFGQLLVPDTTRIEIKQN